MISPVRVSEAAANFSAELQQEILLSSTKNRLSQGAVTCSSSDIFGADPEG